MPPSPVIVVLGAAGLPTARAVLDAVPGAVIHGLRGRIESGVSDVERLFDDTGIHLRKLFSEGRTVIGLCASGILIRALAPLLADKRNEPPVLAVSTDGASVVPLLGGHHGANRLARELARVLDGHAAVTTAGDLQLGIALDEPPAGWKLANPEAAKAVASALLARKAVGLTVEAGSADWLSGLDLSDDGKVFGDAPRIRVTDRDDGVDGALTFYPPVLTVGVGCERNLPPGELSSLVHDVLAAHGLSPKAVACVASLDLKADEPAVHALADELGVPARFFSAEELNEQTSRLMTPSEVVFGEVGCYGVCEGAALAACGPEAVLVSAKTKTARATCAIARAPAPFDPLCVGQARGRLFIAGVGPGTPNWRTPEVTRAIAQSSDLVGYPVYLDLVADLSEGKALHTAPMKAETERARQALDLAAQGRTVSLLCSGDPGIYALATLVFELMDTENNPAWDRIDIQVMPGISALQGAAALIGAPINHDFCAISLSNLLTPWEAIERRLQAAAAGDFVVALYNPASKTRREGLLKARDILLTGRPAETPVVIGRNLGRSDEHVAITTLTAMDPDTDGIDMFTTVLIGNSESRATRRGMRDWVYTPRGYAGKWKAQQEQKKDIRR